MVCGDCGAFYGRKVWHSKDKYKSYVWRCNDKFNGEKCLTPILRENDIQQAFITAYNTMVGELDRVIEDCELIYQVVTDTDELDKKISAAEEKVSKCIEQIENLIKQNASRIITADEFGSKYDIACRQQQKVTLQLSKLNEERESKLQKGKRIRIYIETLKSNSSALTEWNGLLFTMMVEKVVVRESGILHFCFFGGQEIEVEVPVVGKK